MPFSEKSVVERESQHEAGAKHERLRRLRGALTIVPDGVVGLSGVGKSQSSLDSSQGHGDGGGTRRGGKNGNSGERSEHL